MIVPAILAGGAGIGLWPYSRELHPKQLLPMVGETTLLQAAVARAGRIGTLPPIVVATEEHRFLVAEQVRGTGAVVLVEPAPKDTAPALAATAAYVADRHGPDAIVVCGPADLVVADEGVLADALREAIRLVHSADLVLVGVPARKPDPSFGYLRTHGPSLTAFVEKPAVNVCEHLISRGALHNAGYVIARAGTLLERIGKTSAEVASAATASVAGARADLDFVRLADAGTPRLSFERAVLADPTGVCVVACDPGLIDIGSWAALWAANPADAQGNVVRGDAATLGTTGSHIHSQHRLVAAVGLDGVVIVETADAVLVASKERVGEVAALVDRLRTDGREEVRAHRHVARPWGSYDSIDRGPGFQVKRITVRPGGSLSLQLHHQRAEHWVVVRGTATITRGDQVFELGADQSTYIPREMAHRLENRGTEPLEMIEVQTGGYLGEDDIVRLDDIYGRR